MAGAGRPSTSSFADAQTWMPVPTSGTTSELRHERQPLLHTRRPRSHRASPGARQSRAASPRPASSSAPHDTSPPARTAAPIPTEGAETISFGLDPLIEAAAPLLQLLGRLRSTYSQPDPGDLRERTIQQIRALRAGGARCRNPDGAASPGALRAVRQPRRRGAEHPLGQHRRLGGALAGLDLPPGGAQRRALLRSAKPTPSEPGHIPAGARTNVSLPQPRLPGPLSPVAARTR